MVTRNESFGSIGEKLVQIELLKRGINFWEMAGNNSYFDLIVETNNGLKKVQIKTSRPTLANKGFQFHLVNCNGGYDYLVLVAISNEEERAFYIISEEEIQQTAIRITNQTKERYAKFKDNWAAFSK